MLSSQLVAKKPFLHGLRLTASPDDEKHFWIRVDCLNFVRVRSGGGRLRIVVENAIHHTDMSQFLKVVAVF